MSEPTASPAPVSPVAPSRLNVTFTMPAPPRRKWVKFVILFLVAVILVLFSMNMFLGAALNVLGGKGDRLVEEVIRKPGEGVKEKVVIFPVEGTVDNDMVDRVRRFCDHVKDDPDVKAVILEINSPGGGITASDEIHHLFDNLRNQYGKKLTVSMRTLAASGGYYVAMPAERIYAEQTTLTGSIGVIWPAFEVTGMMKNIGVKPEIIKSTQASDYKDAGSPLKEFTEKDRDYIRGILNNAHARFKAVVAAGRGTRLTQPVDNVAIGKIWTAEEALNLGLIDGIKYPDEVITQVCSDIGVLQPKVIKLKPRGGFFDSVGASTGLTGGSTKIELHLDPQQVREALTSKIEFLYTGPTP